MIIFMGVAGAGKSHQGKLLADELGLPWLSTGEFLRMLIAGERRQAMVAGQLLGDQETIALVQKIFTVVDTNQEFVLDGFPRSIAQADWLLAQVKYGQLKVTAVIHLTASEQVIRERLLKRGRPDDYDKAISDRVNEFQKTILPILEHFREAGIRIHEISGESDAQQVHTAIVTALHDAVHHL